MDMEKSYDPQNIEKKLYTAWEESGYFKSNKLEKDSYCIMLPPPNVTGSLHMGHAFQDTLMDALIRFNRMCGKDALWQCGTDHAGIATQIVVERQLAKKGVSRRDLGRDAFLKEAWQWKGESGGTITEQLRRMGSSMDWSREKFTLDDELSNTVKQVFISLYREGLIYRGKRLVNWDPVLKTAISDLEVISEEENGSLWHMCYEVEGTQDKIIVATTRPETMLGDTAVAVHPDDPRYKHLIGSSVILPIANRLIPVIADEYVDQDFGSGCVKITPAHDFNDYLMGQRHNLALINILNDDATLNDDVPERYRGLDRFVARDLVVKEMQSLGLLKKIDDHTLMVPRGDRTRTVIEPYLTDQWFVQVAELAQPAIKAVEQGDVKFIPENWSKTYFEWMNNIQDWCISRQLWWGHRIPAYYDDDGAIYVGSDEADARKYGGVPASVALRQDEDVLDTWFSSALWPFSTLGWPNQTPEFKQHYPTNVLVTGFDIIFFWVARMIMMGLKFTGSVPFKEVYIHGLVRDAKGQKMSKSKGNILDPLDLIDGIDLNHLVTKRRAGVMKPEDADKIELETRSEFPKGIESFGTDALRFTFAIMATQGRDIRFDLTRINGYKNFCNKVWNAARFVLLVVEQHQGRTSEKDFLIGVPEQWIRERFRVSINQVVRGFKEYRFDRSAQSLYEFVWDDYCDWYIEASKVRLYSDETSQPLKDGICSVLIEMLEGLLKALHPIMPFITEEIWLKLRPLLPPRGESIMLESYPEPKKHNDAKAVETFEWLKDFVLGIRRIRADYNIEPKKVLSMSILGSSEEQLGWLEQNEDIIMAVARVGRISQAKEPLIEAATVLVGELTLYIPFEGLIEKKAERARLQKELLKAEQEATQTSKKLENQSFTDRAPEKVVKEMRARLEIAANMIAKLQIQMKKF
jgi:valyl-tRNA synthetase